MSLAERKKILSAAGRVRDVDVHEPAIVQRRQRDHGRKRPARVQTLVHRIAALFQRQNADVRVLDGEEFQHALPQQVIRPGNRLGTGNARRRMNRG